MKNTDTDSKMSLAQALKIIKCREGADFPLFKVKLAELERFTGITRAHLRRLKANGFEEKEHGLIGTKHKTTVLTGYTSVIDNLLRQNCPNSAVCYAQLQKVGYKDGLTAVKDYIRAHKNLLPAPKHIVHRRETGENDILRHRARHFRWTGDSWMSLMGAETETGQQFLR